MPRAPQDDDDAGRRVPIGDSASDEQEEAPSGLPPHPRRRGPTVDDEPESQETG